MVNDASAKKKIKNNFLVERDGNSMRNTVVKVITAGIIYFIR